MKPRDALLVKIAAAKNAAKWQLRIIMVMELCEILLIVSFHWGGGNVWAGGNPKKCERPVM